MFKLFNQDTPFMRGFHTFADLAVLNILWLLCSLPVFTIGASTAALYGCLFSHLEGGENGARKFFRVFREKFKTATLTWLLFLLAALVLFADWRLTLSGDFPLRSVLVITYGIIGMLLAVLYPFLFPLVSAFPWGVRKSLKNAFLCGIAWLPRTALMLVLNLLPFILFLLSPYYFIYFGWVWLAIGFSLIAYLCTRLMKKPMAILTGKSEDKPTEEE